MNEPNLDDLLACATEAARAAGHHAQTNLHRRTEVLQRFAHDVKLNLDREAQDQAEEVILAHFPSHSVLGEEGSIEGEDPAYRWVLDPIDGTVNFAHRMPLWCSSVAVQKNETTVAGAVYVPPLNELYTAHAEGPALMNGEPIAPSDIRDMDLALIVTGMSKFIEADSPSFQTMKALSLKVQKVRVMGAAAIDICHVACGRAEAYAESSIYLWDVAAAGLIAQRAGAKAEVLHRREGYRMSYLCSNGLLHEEIKKLFNRT